MCEKDVTDILIENPSDQEEITLLKINEKKKRDDLQIWRTIAIIGVIIFHIWPNMFKNGYLGVDIFFVLSGYLMSNIIEKQQNKINKDIIVDFYFRRIKRLAPVYLIILTLIIVSLSSFLWSSEFETLSIDSKWASVFLTNIQDYVTELDYFDMQSRHRYFRHCWSIAVEMQFYLFVPLIFSLWKNFLPKFKLILILSLTILSYLHQISSDDAFNQYESLLSRIWQFMFGILAQNYALKHHLNFKQKLFYLLLLNLTLIVIFIPIYEFNRNVITLITVLMTSLIIYSSYTDKDSPFDSVIECNSISYPLVYLGDISYVVYLVHWPIITYFRFITTDEINLPCGLLLIVVIVIVSVICHHLIEKPCLSYIKTKLNLLFFTFILYLFLFTTLPLLRYKIEQNEQLNDRTTDFVQMLYDFDQPVKIPSDWTQDDTIKVAIELMDIMKQRVNSCIRSEANFTSIVFKKDMYYCQTENINSLTNFTAVVVGNSHSMFTAPMIHYSKKFTNVYQISGLGCAFPEKYFQSKAHCPLIHKATLDLIEKVKPDVVFMIFANLGEFLQPIRDKMNNDKAYKIITQYMSQIYNHTKAVVVSSANIRFQMKITPEYLKMIKFQKNFNDLKRKRIDAVSSEKYIEKRLETLQREYPKCVILKPVVPFCDEEYCYAYDDKLNLPRFSDSSHHTVVALRSYYPYMDRIIDKALKVANLI